MRLTRSVLLLALGFVSQAPPVWAVTWSLPPPGPSADPLITEYLVQVEAEFFRAWQRPPGLRC